MKPALSIAVDTGDVTGDQVTRHERVAGDVSGLAAETARSGVGMEGRRKG